MIQKLLRNMIQQVCESFKCQDHLFSMVLLYRKMQLLREVSGGMLGLSGKRRNR
jgi:hypothetical protein